MNGGLDVAHVVSEPSTIVSGPAPGGRGGHRLGKKMPTSRPFGSGMTLPSPTFLAYVSIGEERLLTLGKLSLVLVTLLCLSSMGGAMLVAFPFLVPLHWFAARDSRPFAVGGWALLSALSVLQGVWMLAYLGSDNATVGLIVALTAATALAVVFLLQAADRAAPRPTAPEGVGKAPPG